MAKRETKLTGKDWRLELIKKQPLAAKELLSLILDAESAPVTDPGSALSWITDDAIPRLYECLLAMAVILDRFPEVDQKMNREDRAKKPNGDVCTEWIELCIWMNRDEGKAIGYYAKQLRLLHLLLLKERDERKSRTEVDLAPKMLAE